SERSSVSSTWSPTRPRTSSTMAARRSPGIRSRSRVMRRDEISEDGGVFLLGFIADGPVVPNPAPRMGDVAGPEVASSDPRGRSGGWFGRARLGGRFVYSLVVQLAKLVAAWSFLMRAVTHTP